MSLELRIKTDIRTAMLSKDKERLSFLRMAFSEIQLEYSRKTDNTELTDIDIEVVLKKMRKNAVIMNNEYEIGVIDSYLPKGLTEAETKVIITKIVNDNDYTMKDMGKVMKELKMNYKDVDMKTASILFKNIFK